MVKNLEQKDIDRTELLSFHSGQRKGIFCTGNMRLLTYGVGHKWNLSGLRYAPTDTGR